MFRGLRLLLSLCVPLGAANAQDGLEWSDSGKIKLVGPHDGHQLVVLTPGRDVTREVPWSSQPPDVARVSNSPLFGCEASAHRPVLICPSGLNGSTGIIT